MHRGFLGWTPSPQALSQFTFAVLGFKGHGRDLYEEVPINAFTTKTLLGSLCAYHLRISRANLIGRIHYMSARKTFCIFP